VCVLLAAAAMDINDIDEDQFEDVDDDQWLTVYHIFDCCQTILGLYWIDHEAVNFVTQKKVKI